MKYILLAVLSVFFSACGSSTATAPAAPIIYQFDLTGSIDGVAFDGIGIIPSGASHDIKIQSTTDVNIFTVTSCHRFFKAEDVIKTGWFETNRGYDYTFTPAPGIEDTTACPVRLGAYTKEVGANQHQALIVNHPPQYNLPGENICDGADGFTTGVSVCSTKAGLLERLKFTVPVLSPNVKNLKDGTIVCAVTQIDAYTFEYTVPLGECVIDFEEASAPHRKYHHEVAGWNTFQYSGGN